MIELTQVKSTDKLGQLQGILNKAFSEVQTDQPFIGVCQNISINAYDKATLSAAITAPNLTNARLYALCFPESNGVFVAKVFGRVQFTFPTATTFNRLQIDVPTIKIATREANVSTFVSPSRLGLGDLLQTDHMYTGASWYAGEDNADARLLFTNIYSKDTSCDISLTTHDLLSITDSGAGTATLYL